MQTRLSSDYYFRHYQQAYETLMRQQAETMRDTTIANTITADLKLQAILNSQSTQQYTFPPAK